MRVIREKLSTGDWVVSVWDGNEKIEDHFFKSRTVDEVMSGTKAFAFLQSVEIELENAKRERLHGPQVCEVCEKPLVYSKQYGWFHERSNYGRTGDHFPAPKTTTQPARFEANRPELAHR
jgi:hypothetical protein